MLVCHEPIQRVPESRRNSPRREVSFTEDTILEHAIKSENVAELSGILDRQGQSPNSLIRQGELPLHISVKKDRLQSTKVLLEQGVDVNLQDEEGQTALHYAIANDNIALVLLLIEAGGDLFVHDDHGILPTALYKSAKMKNFLNDKIFDHTMANLQRMLNTSENGGHEPSPSNRLGLRRLSDTDLTPSRNRIGLQRRVSDTDLAVMQGSKRRIRSRTFSDSGVDKPKSILKKYSAYAPRVSIVCEVRESVESLDSEDKQEDKRQKMLSVSETITETGSDKSEDTDQKREKDNAKTRRGNFLVRAIWSTRKRFNFKIKR